MICVISKQSIAPLVTFDADNIALCRKEAREAIEHYRQLLRAGIRSHNAPACRLTPLKREEQL
jgi:hypothetical protein